MIFDIFLLFCLGFDHSYCNLGSDPFRPDVGLGDETSTKKIEKTKFRGNLPQIPKRTESLLATTKNTETIAKIK